MTLSTVSILNQFNMHGTQFSKEECMGGPYCPGSLPIPSASVGNRTLEVALKFYSNSTISNNVHYLWFRFFDANTNQTIQHVSFFLNVTDGGDSLLRGLFNAPMGIITLQANTITAPFNGTALGDREPILGGWMPHDDKPVVVYAPVFSDVNSIYRLKITMGTIDNDNNMFTDQSIAPQFVSDFNVKEQNMIKTMIPFWVNNDAKLWSEGNVDNSYFVQVLHYLIENEMKTMLPDGILTFIHPSLSHPTIIPSWIRNDAGWWADGKISDTDFVNAMYYLLDKGIIRL